MALPTAYMNACGLLFVLCVAWVNGFRKEDDVLLDISISENSRNILYTAVVERKREMKVIGLTGVYESGLYKMSDYVSGTRNGEI